MRKATAKNEIQVILQEYLGNRKAMKVAEAVYEVMRAGTQYTYNGKNIFINEDVNGELVLITEDMVKESVEKILYQNLEEDEVEECLEQLMSESILTETEMTMSIETIQVEGSDSKIYSKMLKYKPVNHDAKEFMKDLRTAIKAGVKPFKVPVCDMSMDENGKPCFIPGRKPAVGLSYNELEQIAEENGLALGNKNQYVLFLATMIERLKAVNWSQAEAIYAVCTDSTRLGHYANSAVAKDYFELTGSRKIVGKCDLANAHKILAKDEKAGGFWIAGGSYDFNGNFFPLACLLRENNYDKRNYDSVGWFVFL